MPRALVAILVTVCLGIAAPAHAQSATRLPPVVVDIRGAWAKVGTGVATAADLNVLSLPHSTFAATVGVHTYPFRRHGFAIGVGGEGLFTRVASWTGQPALTPVDQDPATGLKIAPTIERRLYGVSGIVSFNFGGRDGWSYLSGGAGPLRFETTSSAVAHDVPAWRKTTNFGGGVRWFTNQRMAAGFDVRIYLAHIQPTTGSPILRQKVVVFSVGISIR